MATVDKDIAVQLMKNNGHFSDDPQADNIWEYIHRMTGVVCYAIYYSPYTLLPSEFVAKPRLLWERKGGQTVYGALLLGGEAKKAGN